MGRGLATSPLGRQQASGASREALGTPSSAQPTHLWEAGPEDRFEDVYSTTTATPRSTWDYADAFLQSASPTVRALLERPTQEVALVDGTLGKTAALHLGDAKLWPVIAQLTGRARLPDPRRPAPDLRLQVPVRQANLQTNKLPFAAMADVATATTTAGRDFVALQMEKHPDVRQVHQQLNRVLMGPHPPRTLLDLIKTARTLAERTIAPGFGGAERPRWVMAVALTALAAHGLGMPSEGRERFPQFLHDGRDIARGVDASWHVVTHMMFAYLFRLDDELGSGEVRDLLAESAAKTDRDGYADLISQAYERTAGAPVPLLPGSLPIGGDLGPSTYVPPPTGLSDRETAAYEATMRISNAYEHLTTYDRFAGYDPTQLGTHPELTDPFARFVFELHTSRGLSEAAVNRDISANRIGTKLGLELYRDPSANPDIPFDVGESWSGRPYEKRDEVPQEAWLEEQLGLLTTLLDQSPNPPEGSTAPQEVLHLVEAALLKVERNDPAQLPRVFANLVARQQRWLVPLSGRGSASFDDLEKEARDQPAAVLVAWAQAVFSQMLERLTPQTASAAAQAAVHTAGPSWVSVRNASI